MTFEDLELGAWPRKDHNLRAASGDDRIYAFLAWQGGRGPQGRIMGYRRAAEILASAMLSGASTRDLDTVIFPFAACWRHYIELQLKSLISECQQLLDLPIQRRGGHDVQQLWSELRALLVRAYPREERSDRSIVGRLLLQLAEMDPDNQNFRYSERRDGTPTLTGVDHLDIWEFHQAMLGVANYFEAVSLAIDHDQDLKNEARQYEWERQQEYEQEMREYYGYDNDYN